ncbi:MAG TPA: hypothetical protein VFU35_09850, partial [Jatrophihabitans sp.]|nr:hypothetical protein [Jatrophihabitans sp.]
GRDRGYRALGFAAAGALPISQETPVRLGESVRAAADRSRDDWTLVVDDDERPQGWLAVGRLSDAALEQEISPDLLNLGGTLAGESGTMREALDAALSSPSGRGVIVHDDGSLAGTVTAAGVLTKIEERSAAIRVEAVQAAAGALSG